MRTGEGQRKVKDRGKGKEMQKQNRGKKKGNHTVSCSKVRAIPLQSVSQCVQTNTIPKKKSEYGDMG